MSWWHRALGAITVATLVTLWPALLPGPASAFPLTNCTLAVTGIGPDGRPIDTVRGGAPDATAANPLVVDGDGTITWTGATGGVVLRNPRWSFTLFGMPLPVGGSDANAAGLATAGGTINLPSTLPFSTVGTVYISATLTGDGGATCAGSAWVQFRGDVLESVPFFVAAGLTIVGLLLLISAASGAWLAGILGGLVAGAAAVVWAVIAGVFPFGEFSPWAFLAAATLLGLLFGLARREELESPPAPAARRAGPTPQDDGGEPG